MGLTGTSPAPPSPRADARHASGCRNGEARPRGTLAGLTCISLVCQLGSRAINRARVSREIKTENRPPPARSPRSAKLNKWNAICRISRERATDRRFVRRRGLPRNTRGCAFFRKIVKLAGREDGIRKKERTLGLRLRVYGERGRERERETRVRAFTIIPARCWNKFSPT